VSLEPLMYNIGGSRVSRALATNTTVLRVPNTCLTCPATERHSRHLLGTTRWQPVQVRPRDLLEEMHKTRTCFEFSASKSLVC